VLLHVTSLPGRFRVGDLGPVAREWIDLLADAKQRWWQMLPLTPPGAEHSPYESFSAFAGNPLLISPQDLVEEGLLRPTDLPKASKPASRVDFPAALRQKRPLLIAAADKFFAGRRLREAYEDFCQEQKDWLDDYALFVAIRETHGGKHWSQWPAELVCRQPNALHEAARQLAPLVDRERFIQFMFDRQLQRLRAYAKRRGIGLIGDVPIFVSYSAADVWSHPQLFQLDKHRRPTAVAGVPPDAFSATGQRWGNPLYDWSAMQAEGFRWWIRRLRQVLRQCDLVRLDHFRGFQAYWRIPANSEDARRGKWVEAPGTALLTAVRRELGTLPLIAEDLGVVTTAVEKLRNEFGLPGMRVIQFAFDSDASNPHLPHNFVRNCVVFPGTHDNDTTVGWYRSLDANKRKRVADYIGLRLAGQDVPLHLIRLAWSSVADLAIVSAQDLLALPSSARMNSPGTHQGNWRWRLNSFASFQTCWELVEDLTRTFGR
jgi:4-alpha-glucanotransferase